jgi:Tfp pilus assembly protein PilF
MATTRAYQHRDRLPAIEREITTAYYYTAVDVREDSAEAAYRRVLAIDPTNGIALNNLSLLLSEVGRFAEAESLAAVGVTLPSSSSNTYLQLVNAQLGANELAEARKTLGAYAKVDSGSPSYIRGRALYFMAAGQADSAERTWVELGLKVRDPTYQRFSYGGLAFLAQQHGRLAEADKQGEQWLAVTEAEGLPGDALVGAARRAARRALFLRDTVGAIQALQSGLAKHPLASMPALDRPYGELAYAYAIAGRTADAKRLLAEYESAVPPGIRQGDAMMYRARGWVALAENRPKDAIAEFEAMGAKGQRAEWGRWDLGVAFERAGQPDSAIAAYESAAAPGGTGWKAVVENASALAPSYKRLGELYEERGDKTRAATYYSRFVDLWKDADPPLQPAVREVKGRLAGLAGESRAAR